MQSNTPLAWRTTTVSELLEWDAPGFWGDEPTADGQAVPVLRSTNFTESGALDLRKLAYRSFAAKVLKAKALASGDILLERSGGGPDTPVGRVTWFGESEPYYYSNFIQALRTRSDVSARFVFYLLWNLHASGVTKTLQQATTGIRNLAYKDYLAWIVPLPPLPEQKKIAEILGSVDEAIRATEAVIKQTRKVKEGLFQELLTKGIGHTKFKQTEIGEIPEGWEVKTLGDVAEVSNGSTPSRSNGAYWSGTVPWVASGKVNDYVISEPSEYITEEALRKCPLKLIPKGSVVVGMIGQGKTRGMSAFLSIDAAINQNLAAIVPSSALRGGYLHAYLTWSYEKLRGTGRGSNQDALNCGIVRKFPIALPPPVEQDRILESLTSLDATLASNRAAVARQLELKHGLLQDLLTGQVRVKA